MNKTVVSVVTKHKYQMCENQICYCRTKY